MNSMLEDIREKLTLLPKISQIAAHENFGAKKSLGQNFLIDETIVRQIVNSSKISSDIPVFEIGPGLGSLTREIMYKGVSEIHLIEKDERFIHLLQELQSIHPNLTIHHADALTFDERSLLIDTNNSKIQIIANLPYNIGTALVLKWLNNSDIFKSITVMLQKEVAKKFDASPKDSSYGSLSVFTQAICEVEYILDVPPESFAPRPSVDSTVIMLTPKEQLAEGLDLVKLEKILKISFQGKRKMLRKALSECFGNRMEDILAACGIKSTARAQELSVDDYINLSKHLKIL